MANKSVPGLDNLSSFFGDILARLEALESKAGVSAPPALASSASAVLPKPDVAAGELPAVKAYDAYVKECVVPFVKVCDDLQLKDTGTLLTQCSEGIRTVIVLASRSKMPNEDMTEVLPPLLTQTTEAVKKIREQRLPRDFDRHEKALNEVIPCFSWVMYRAPRQLPGPIVKECLSSAEFWTNRIRKDFKGKDELHIVFCDCLKKFLLGLAAYIEENHKTGLTFNPKGTSLAEAAIRLSDNPVDAEIIKSPVQKRHPTLGTTLGGNLAGVMGELNKRKNADGSSAATGLRKVTKDQQTWRKEFKGKGEPVAPPLEAPAAPVKKEEPKKKTQLRGIPIFEYQDRGFKWVVENQTKDSAMKEETAKNGAINIDITDPKQQVYLYNSDGITVKVTGKFKSLVIDKCTNCAVVYDTIISSAEVVNCKKIQLQVNGVCPVFTIDKTMNVLVWLSKESLEVSRFTTSLSSEMNVSFPDGDEQKEVPIPEQFVHKIEKGSVSSEVSDLYGK